MAIVTIKAVTKWVNSTGNGFVAVEKKTIRGQEIDVYWNVWPEGDTGVQPGVEVEVQGLHGDKVEEKDSRSFVKRSINNAKVKITGSAPAKAEDAWAEVDAPF